MNRVLGVHEHEVAREREVRARADRGAVHRRDRRLVELPQLADERLHADAQRLRGAAGREPGLGRACATVDAVRSMPAQNASPVPVMQQRAHVVVGPARRAPRRRCASRISIVERVLRVGPVERDAADAVGADLVRGCTSPARQARFVVRMLTTDTPEPRPPTLCWSA